MRFDEATLTRGVYQALHAARRTLKGVISADRLHRLDDTIDGILARNDVDLDDVLGQLRDEERTVLGAEVAKRRLDRAFTFDPAVLHDLTRTKRFRGDHGLTVEVEAAYADVVIEEGEPDSAGKRTFVLHTRDWEPQ